MIFHGNNFITMRNGRHSSLLHGATFARQRQAELLYPGRGAGRAGRPAHCVRVVSLKQSLPLFGTGQFQESLAGCMVSGRPGDEPAHWALALVLGVVVLRGWGDKSKTMQFHHEAKFDQGTLHDGQPDSQASSSTCADALQGMWVTGTGLDSWPETS